MNCALSYRDECFAAMAQCFVCAPSFRSVTMFRDEHCANMMKTAAGENEFSTLTIPNLKTRVSTEHGALMKAIKKVVLEKYEEGHRNCFCQFVRGRDTLKKKDKHQAMGMKLGGKDFKHDGVVALPFRKPTTYEADKVSELAEKECCEAFDLKFQEKFSSLFQDLAASATTKELEVCKVECGTRQGGKVGASVVG